MTQHQARLGADVKLASVEVVLAAAGIQVYPKEYIETYKKAQLAKHGGNLWYHWSPAVMIIALLAVIVTSALLVVSPLIEFFSVVFAGGSAAFGTIAFWDAHGLARSAVHANTMWLWTLYAFIIASASGVLCWLCDKMAIEPHMWRLCDANALPVAMPNEARVLMAEVKALYPNADFKVDVLAKDPILYTLLPGGPCFSQAFYTQEKHAIYIW